MPDISIIIPTLDPNPRFPWEEDLEASSVDAEVIVRDDPSASGARNAGIEEASADKLVFLDDDSVPRSGYFETVSELLEDHPAVTGRIVDTGWRYTRGISGQYDQGDQGQVTNVVVGCNMAFRRSVIEDVGGFDERLPYGHEETELVDRVAESYAIWYSPDLVVEHPFADSLLDYYEKAYRHGREEVTYAVIKEKNVLRHALGIVLEPSRYISTTPTRVLLRVTAQLVTIVGLARGYVSYLSRSRGRGDGPVSN